VISAISSSSVTRWWAVESTTGTSNRPAAADGVLQARSNADVHTMVWSVAAPRWCGRSDSTACTCRWRQQWLRTHVCLPEAAVLTTCTQRHRPRRERWVTFRRQATPDVPFGWRWGSREAAPRRRQVAQPRGPVLSVEGLCSFRSPGVDGAFAAAFGF
jgi:hypothetical protein